MSVQFTTFHANFVRQMEDYRQRRATLLKAELEKRGVDPPDFARSLGASTRTGDRWVATGTIQRQYRKKVADALSLPFEILFPDYVAEEKTLRDQLDRIEAALAVLDSIDERLEALESRLSQLDEAEADPRTPTRPPARRPRVTSDADPTRRRKAN